MNARFRLPQWQRRGACVGRWSLFDRAVNARPGRVSGAVIELQRLCVGCPVRDLCRDYGTATGSDGVWGGVELTAGQPQPSTPPLRAAG